MTQYRYFITDQSTSARRQVYPLGRLRYKYEKNSGNIFFQRKLDTKFVFVNIPEDGTYDFDYFYDIETSTEKCRTMAFEIQKSCDRGLTWSIDWSGTFGTSDGEWDLDKCRFEVTPIVSGNYNCLLTDVKFNILDIEPTVSVFVDFSGTTEDRTYTRCRLFNDMLHFLATQTCDDITGVVSNFFQINPTVPSAINYVTQETNTYIQMCVAQKSDIKEPVPSDAATSAPISFKKCMEDLKKLFNVYWTIEGSSVRIEHLSYFDSTAGLDLTTAAYEKYASGTRKYKYNRIEMPRYETWEMPESSMGAKITYDNSCGNDQENESEIKYVVSEFYTDYSSIRWFPEQVSNLNGLFLFATQYNSGSGLYEMYGSGRNEELILGRLVLRFQRYGRPQLNGSLEYFAQPDSSVINAAVLDKSHPDYGDLLIWTANKNKEQQSFKIPFCCSDEFDVSKYVTTPLGNGDVVSAQHDTKSDTLDLVLKYGEGARTELASPLDLSGLDAWYKSDTGVTTVGADVDQWADQSGNGRTLSAPAATNRPLLVASVLNGYPAIRFDGVDNRLASAAFTSFPAKRGTCFVVIRPFFANIPQDKLVVGTYDGVTADTWDVSVDRESLTPTFEMASASEGHHWKISDEIGGAHSYGVPTPTQDRYFQFSINRTSNTEYFGWYSGKKHRETANSNPMPATGQSGNLPLAVGGTVNDTNWYDGDIVEIIIYSRSLTDLERQYVERYLFKRYADLRSYMIV